MVTSYRIRDVIHFGWRESSRLKKEVLEKPHTGMLIFSPDDESFYNLFMEGYKGTVLFVSNPAVNMNPGHGTTPRNVLVIFSNETSQEENEMPGVRRTWERLFGR